MHDRPIIALDFSHAKRSGCFFRKKFPKEEALFVKVGMELFLRRRTSDCSLGLKNKDTMFSWI